MANREMETDKWVDDRLAALASASEWSPDAAPALARLHQRRRARRLATQRWIWTTLVTSGVTAALFFAPASRACAKKPGACVLQAWRAVTTTTNHNFQEVGSASAPIAVEVYLGNDCPHCETFMHDVVPLLSEHYIQTGKVKLQVWSESAQPLVVIVVSAGNRHVIRGEPTFESLKHTIDELTLN